jgi:predicted Zn-dependent protease
MNRQPDDSEPTHPAAHDRLIECRRRVRQSRAKTGAVAPLVEAETSRAVTPGYSSDMRPGRRRVRNEGIKA